MTYFGITFPIYFAGFFSACAFLLLLVYIFLRIETYKRKLRVYFWRWNKLDSLVRFGVYATGTFALVIVVFSGFPSCEETEVAADCSYKLADFFVAKPNEVGDALAGFAGVLAFFWLILTVLLQGKELSAQRQELRLTRKEFERMSAAQKEQVLLLERQGEIFAEEQKQRGEQVSSKILDQMLELLISNIKYFGDRVYFTTNKGRIVYAAEADDFQVIENEHLKFFLIPTLLETDKIEENVEHLEAGLLKKTVLIEYCSKQKVEILSLSGDGELNELLDLVDEILDMQSSLGQADLYRFERLRMEFVKDDLAEILEFVQKSGIQS